MSKRNLNDLRDHLFDTLERLKDKDNPMELERAKAIASVGQTIINSATVEVKAMNASSAAGYTGFFDTPATARPALPAGSGIAANKPNGKEKPVLPRDMRDPLQLEPRTEPPGR